MNYANILTKKYKLSAFYLSLFYTDPTTVVMGLYDIRLSMG